MFEKIKEEINVVFERDPASRSILETIFTCPGFQAILFHRINHWLWQKKFCLLARISAHITRFLTGIEIHPGAVIGRRFFIDHGMGIVIGETAEIGDDVSIYHGVTLGGTTWSPGKRHPTLKDNVVVGAGAKILGAITIERGARVGCNAVVVKDIPAEMTVVGVPGNIVDKTNKNISIAKKMGFTAYAESKDTQDPMQNTLNSILIHLQKVEKELEQLKKR